MDETTLVLRKLRDRLNERGVAATGPHRGIPSPEWDYVGLPSGRHVHVQLDSGGYWQALMYEGERLVRIADVDGGDWPGDPV